MVFLYVRISVFVLGNYVITLMYSSSIYLKWICFGERENKGSPSLGKEMSQERVPCISPSLFTSLGKAFIPFLMHKSIQYFLITVSLQVYFIMDFLALLNAEAIIKLFIVLCCCICVWILMRWIGLCLYLVCDHVWINTIDDLDISIDEKLNFICSWFDEAR